MNGPSLPEIATASKLRLIHTEAGFDLLIDPSDYISVLLERDGLYEVAETELVSRILRPKDTCIDAGCQIGYYSCLFAKLVGEEGHVYSFDANPSACQTTRRNLALNGAYSAEVIPSALADYGGTVPFHVSPDDQSGLSSLGKIPTCKATISVPVMRLEAFLKERRVNGVRLLKIDVEGAEEMVLRGLGHFLDDHLIDYIIIECFDERLKLLDASTEAVASVLTSAGYTPWEYGMQNTVGWFRAASVRSRGDCNYLFASPEVGNDVPNFSLAAALRGLIQKRIELTAETNRLRCEIASLNQNLNNLSNDLNKLHSDIDWLLGSIKAREEELAGLSAQKGDLEAVLRQIQNSAGWRMLNRWRYLRNRLVPEHSWPRKLYDSVLGNFRDNA